MPLVCHSLSRRSNIDTQKGLRKPGSQGTAAIRWPDRLMVLDSSTVSSQMDRCVRLTSSTFQFDQRFERFQTIL